MNSALRVAVLTRSCGLEAGAETYVQQIVNELAQEGCAVALVYENDRLGNRAPMTLPPTAMRLHARALGTAETVARLRAWRPDVVYTQGLDDIELEELLTRGFATAAFTHNYVGMCISGTKTRSFPIPLPCSRTLGPGCLLNYLPRRCGGLNPATMVRRYAVEKRRLALIRTYRAVLTPSAHIRREYLRHGIPADRVRVMPFTLEEHLAPARSDSSGAESAAAHAASTTRPWRLAWVGRMEELKGGHLAIKALPHVAKRLHRPVHLTMIGDGRRQAEWRNLADRIMSSHPDVRVEFTGWVDISTMPARFHAADLLVVPSIWPEPLPLVGIESMFHGLPAAGFDVGGVSDWLVDGVSGMLAPGHPATARGLAKAISRALQDDETLAQLRAGARAIARRYAEANHTQTLLTLFRSIAQTSDGVSADVSATQGSVEPS